MPRLSALLIAIPMALAGCATTPDPEALRTVSGAQASIEQAARADAVDSRALSAAREKLAAAQRALNDGEEEEAIRLAEEARVDAAYAAAVARQQKAQRAVQEIEDAIATLRAETAVP
ncbi:MAG TPA: DUF4398 domain-containing protein [Steroidobacteraceae bacterium]|nr:DUF4398 domain-containing protein [Steroidobacteraceae bacterium]